MKEITVLSYGGLAIDFLMRLGGTMWECALAREDRLVMFCGT